MRGFRFTTGLSFVCLWCSGVLFGIGVVNGSGALIVVGLLAYLVVLMFLEFQVQDRRPLPADPPSTMKP